MIADFITYLKNWAMVQNTRQAKAIENFRAIKTVKSGMCCPICNKSFDFRYLLRISRGKYLYFWNNLGINSNICIMLPDTGPRKRNMDSMEQRMAQQTLKKHAVVAESASFYRKSKFCCSGQGPGPMAGIASLRKSSVDLSPLFMLLFSYHR